ncbi:MAG: TfoX/Sxy family protein [Nocardioides sp.]|nr:TfoX/Sxy family protein [Nocardioides sp.]
MLLPLLSGMAYDDVLAQRIHDLLDGVEGVTSRKMFGGLGFMVHGHMAVAAGSGGALMVRADPDDAASWLAEGVEPMEMNGREMQGWLLVAPEVLDSDADLRVWVDRGVAHVATLPAKQS